MTDPAGIRALQDVIRERHGCESHHVASVPLHERTLDGRQTLWKGDVQVFQLVGHATAKRAYAWSEPALGGKRHLVAVLHAPPVDSPEAALRASLVADTSRK